MRSIAIIPARGGSKRIPRKNLVELAGRPLVAWTIEAALEAALVDMVVVSTEDPTIAEVSRQYGAQVIMRPDALARDTTSTEPVLLHALDEVEKWSGQTPEITVLLQCTSPLRPAHVIDEAILKIVQSGCDSVVGVHPTIDYFFTGSVDGEQLVVEYDPLNRPRTQCITPRYKENGSTYAVRTEFLRRTGCRMGGDMRPVIMSEVEGLDIDDVAELAVARYHLENAHAPSALSTERADA